MRWALLAAAVAMAMAADQRPETMPLFLCGQDQAIDLEIPLRWETIVLAADGRLYMPCPEGRHAIEHRELREMALLVRATLSGTRQAGGRSGAEFARLAAQAFGRIGRVSLDRLERLASHPDPAVRRQVVVAIGAAVDPTPREPFRAVLSGEEVPDAGQPDSARWRARSAQGLALLEARLEVERDEQVVAAILETLGRLPYEDEPQRTRVETRMASYVPTVGAPHRLLGAARGLEALIRRNRAHRLSAETIEQLRAIATHTTANAPFDADAGAVLGNLDVYARARRVALAALTQAGGLDSRTALTAARDQDWQVRRLAVATMDAGNPDFRDVVENALADEAFQVRIDALRAAGRSAGRTGDCGRLVRALDDRAPLVVMTALDLLSAGCAERDPWLPGLVDRAASLGRTQPAGEWHVSARALVALARLAPDKVGPALAMAVEHQHWQVRAAAAEVAGILRDEALAIRLASDPEPNVQTAALGVMRQLDSPARFDAALQGLESADFDLIRTSARVLEGTPDPAVAVQALLFRLRQLTDQGWDTSRDPRVEIVRRLGELMTPADVSSLARYVDDFDPRVSLAASDAIMKLTGSDDRPVPRPYVRYPYQPSLETLGALPRVATIHVEGGGVIEMEFVLDQAPVATARFVELAASGYYDGLTFHRVAPNFVIQGGGPGANEYSGVSRYLRDEIGAPNLRGTVGLSTRGRDTGDGQIFINLVDNPRLDGEYTVFARVVAGMDVVDAVLPGARIERITLR